MPDHLAQERSQDGRYRLLEPIAPGPSATVFFGQALGSDGFATTVAIERLRPELRVDPEQPARVCRDARQTARLRHGHLVTTLDSFVAGGMAHVVSEHVTGESLARLMVQAEAQTQPASVPVAAAILCGVLHGLHAIHEATDDLEAPSGRIHAGLSPRSVLVGTDGLARVLGLGLAAERGRRRQVAGDPLPAGVEYLAPEQLLGEPLDRRTDVYAAAVVLWELLARRGLIATSRDRLVGDDPVRKILEADVEPPSAVCPQVPRKLDAVVMRGLNREREARYDTARAFAIALEEAATPATNRLVGDWVSLVAASPLRSRAERLAGLEQRAAGGAAGDSDAGDHLSLPASRGFSTLVSPQPVAVSAQPSAGRQSPAAGQVVGGRGEPVAGADEVVAELKLAAIRNVSHEDYPTIPEGDPVVLPPTSPAGAGPAGPARGPAPARRPTSEPPSDQRPATLPSGALDGSSADRWLPHSEPIPSGAPASLGRDTIELPVSSRKWLVVALAGVVVALVVAWLVI